MVVGSATVRPHWRTIAVVKPAVAGLGGGRTVGLFLSRPTYGRLEPAQPQNLLGHAMLPEQIGVEPHRSVINGKTRWVDTSKNMRFLCTLQRYAKADYVAAGARRSTGGCDGEL